MRKIKLILAMLGLPILALAQTNTFTTTTLSSAIAAANPGQNAVCFTVASGTGINAPAFNNGPFGGTQGTAGSFLLVDTEMIQVQSINGTTVCGYRGIGGTRVSGHLTGTLVFIGNADWYSQAPAGVRPGGSCTKGTLYAYPDIHPIDDTWWACSDGSYWGFAGPGLASNGAPTTWTKKTTTYTALPWDYLIEVDTTSAAFTITLPAASSLPGKVFMFNDVGGDAGTNNLTVSTTSPSTCAKLTTANGTSRVMSNGTSWLCW